MDILTIDMETFYGDDYTLSKMTTEAYVRDPRFETILCGFKINGGKPWYVVGHDDVARQLADLNIPKRIVLAHHAHFDGLILSHHYGLAPRMWLDTLGMARHLHGPHGGLSLAKLAQRYGIGAKGEEVINARNMHLRDFGPQQLHRYGLYCGNDCDLEYELYLKMAPHFSAAELMVNDQVVRMFTQPVLQLDTEMLDAYRQRLAAEKITLLLKAGAQKDDVMSNDKFAALLMELGVEPPRKLSPTFAKKTQEAQTEALNKDKDAAWTWAFAKSDKAMQELQEHPDERVQVLVEARLKNKTTIAEKGAERLIAMGQRGTATVYLKYSGAAGTHRLSGGDLFNWQSMKRGSDLRNATMAPLGHMVCVVDSSTIEARLLDWLAGQEDMVEVYRKADRKEGPDVYCTLASRIYKYPVIKPDEKHGIVGHPQERQMGKVAKLGLGFGMGPEKFIFAVRAQAKDKEGKPLKISGKFSEEVVGIYRESHPQVKKLWRRGEQALECIAGREYGVAVDYRGIVRTAEDGLVLPGINGLEPGIRIWYPDLRRVKAPPGSVFEWEWEFWNGKDRERIYGAKVIENCLAAGTQVLTTRGWVAIEQVLPTDLVHDGVEFVQHGGVVFKSIQNCITVDGVAMTPEHEVLTDEGWKPALEEPRPYRPNLRGVDCAAPTGQRRPEDVLVVPMRLWQGVLEARNERYEGAGARRAPELRVHDRGTASAGQGDARHVGTSGVCGVALHERPMPAALAQGVQELRRPWNRGVQALARLVRSFLAGHGADLHTRPHAGAQEQRQGVFQGELCVGALRSTGAQPAQFAGGGHPGVGGSHRNLAFDAVLPASARPAAYPVYDILNAGPRQRFVVRGSSGPFIVHNCIQCLARIVVIGQCLNTAREVARTGSRWVHSMHDEGIFCCPTFYAPWVLERLEAWFRTAPAFAPDLPLNCEGGYHQRYGLAKK